MNEARLSEQLTKRLLFHGRYAPETDIDASVRKNNEREEAAAEIKRLRSVIESAALRLDAVLKAKPTDANLILDQVHGALETLRSVSP